MNPGFHPFRGIDPSCTNVSSLNYFRNTGVFHETGFKVDFRLPGKFPLFFAKTILEPNVYFICETFLLNIR